MNDIKTETRAVKSDSLRIGGFCGLAMLVLAVAVLLVGRGAAQSQVITNNTPPLLAQAQDLGPENAAKPISVTVWLRSQAKDGVTDQAIEELYRQGSPNYHNWLTREELDAQSPTADEAAVVKNFLAGHNLTVSAVGEGNLYVKASGTVADVQSAFQVQLHRFTQQGTTFRANTAD